MSAPPTITLSFPEPDIAVLTFDMPGKGANLLSSTVRDEFRTILTELEQRTDLHGLVIRSGKPGSFIAGADIREFTGRQITREQTFAMCREGQTLFKRLSQCPFVTVAAIDGVCLGGGAELASWCDVRIITNGPKSEIGFPEVKLGLIPGWGGTARSSRLIGLANAVELVAGGEPVGPAAAMALGLVSDVVPTDCLMLAAIQRVRTEQQTRVFVQERARRLLPLSMPANEIEFLRMAGSSKIQDQTKGHYPAPLVALNLMLEAASLDLDGACVREAEEMAKLFGSPVNLSLINVFFLTDRMKRDSGLTRSDIQTPPVKSLGVVGAGVMGAGIAAVTIKRDIPVAVHDASTEALEKCVRMVIEDVSYDKKTNGPNPDRAVHFAPLLNTSSELAPLASCDLVIEAILENGDVKKQFFAKLEPLLSPNAVLASNTSTIPITRLAENLQRPEQFCGIHFFNPVRRMKLVEIIRGDRTSDETIATAVTFAKRIGKIPIVVKDGPGFLVNRLLRCYLNEALQLLTEGTPMADIERASFAFGMPIGPFTLYDLVGIDTSYYAGKTMWQAFPDRVVTSPVLPALMKAGRFGQKTGLGFYSYQNKQGTAEPDPVVDKLIGMYLRTDRQADQEEITYRLFLPMLVEATRIIEEKRVRDVRDIDLGVIFGLGFPAFRGGLMYWGDSLGAAKIVEQLRRLDFLGARSKPTELLLEMAKSGKKFYE